MHTDDYLLDMLGDLGYATPDQIACARKDMEGSETRGAVDLLLERNIIMPIDVAIAKAGHFGANFIRLQSETIALSRDVIGMVPKRIALKYRVCPIKHNYGTLTVAVLDPSDLATIDSLTHLLNVEIEIVITMPEDIIWALRRYYGFSQEEAETAVNNPIAVAA